MRPNDGGASEEKGLLRRVIADVREVDKDSKSMAIKEGQRP